MCTAGQRVSLTITGPGPSFFTVFIRYRAQETDWEATNEAIEEQVARESYLQWLQVRERVPVVPLFPLKPFFTH